jgi:hypothetical protein
MTKHFIQKAPDGQAILLQYEEGDGGAPIVVEGPETLELSAEEWRQAAALVNKQVGYDKILKHLEPTSGDKPS